MGVVLLGLASFLSLLGGVAGFGATTSAPTSTGPTAPANSYPSWYMSDAECGVSAETIAGTAMQCHRPGFDPWVNPQPNPSSYPGGQGPMHWKPGTFVSSIGEVLDSDGATWKTIRLEDAWFTPRLNDTIEAEVSHDMSRRSKPWHITLVESGTRAQFGRSS
jgi:hypothetical protein